MKEEHTIRDFLIPGLKKLVIFITWVIFLYLYFLFSYMITNRINMIRPEQVHLYFDWETRIPLIPEFMIIYASLPIVFLTPLFLLKTSCLHLLGFRFILIMTISTVIFIVIPTTIGWERQVPNGFFDNGFHFLHYIDKPHNLFPSLHISLSATLVIMVSNNHSSRLLKAALWLWMFLICISVLVVHQHHLADIAGGFLLTYYAIYRVKESPKMIRKLGNKIYHRIRKLLRRE